MDKEITAILREAVNAPSGDNAQPWRFRLKDNQLEIFNDFETDATLYNFRNRGDFVAHGALLTNISLLAKRSGLEIQTELLPDGTPKELIARVSFSENTSFSGESELARYIAKRATNRKPYEVRPLPVEFKQKLNSKSLMLLEDREKIDQLAKVLCLNERLILENQAIHDGLFSFIRWSKEEEEKHREGLYIKTLELAPPQEKAFRIFRNWWLIYLLGYLGVPKLVARDNQKLYRSAGGYLLFTAPDESELSFLKAGMAFQYIWLELTRFGLFAQPTAALLYLGQRVDAGDISHFSTEQVKDIQQANRSIVEVFSLSSGVPVMLLRMGYGPEPSAVSMKKGPIFINN